MNLAKIRFQEAIKNIKKYLINAKEKKKKWDKEEKHGNRP